MMHFEIYRAKASFYSRRRLWYWRLRAKNGEIIAHGEGYHNKEDCYRAVALVQDTSVTTRVEWLN